jgi:hypothetical protein
VYRAVWLPLAPVPIAMPKARVMAIIQTIDVDEPRN